MIFTAEELAKARRISQWSRQREKRAHLASAVNAYQLPYVPSYDRPHVPSPAKPISFNPGGGLFGGNPRQFNQAWDLTEPGPRSWMAPAPRMTFGDSLGIAKRGLGRQFGNYAQMLFAGHGGSSIAGNLFSDAVNTVTGRPPSLHGLGQSFSEPWRRALHGGPTGGLSEAWRQTGMPGEWLSAQVAPNYQFLKNWLFSNAPK